MTEYGYFLSSEEHGPREIVEQAQRAEAAGFAAVSISDHFHPWMDSQGESPFVWTTIGGIAATTNLEVTTGVTCPTMRIHPAILAQATATASAALNGRFRFGVGTGERLNEHVLGQHWPPAGVRLDMLTEAVELMRELWKGDTVTRHGTHFTTENAQIYTTPAADIPVLVSAFGPKAAETAAGIGDGFVSTSPAKDVLDEYRKHGGKGIALATVKVCWAADEDSAAKTAHRLWASAGVPGESAQELSMPAHFEQAADLVSPEQLTEKMPCGPDPDRYVDAILEYIDAGFDEIHLGQIGHDLDGFLRFWQEELAPRL
ncbi:MAG: TIGR03557 family F420-dependent LLM class oxidoreductase [Acidimicrobiales bacterium]|nr:TIGR03557 family F420-dependent LLM class oxidoreductase [Acidimicrobiales bacterium]